MSADDMLLGETDGVDEYAQICEATRRRCGTWRDFAEIVEPDDGSSPAP